MPSYIETYNHQNRIGVLIEFRCDDGWALMTREFKVFARDLALHIAANNDSDLPRTSQPFVKNPSETVADQFKTISRTLGKRISVARYEHYEASKI